MCCVNNDAVPVEVDETQSLVEPIFVWKNFDLDDDVCGNIWCKSELQIYLQNRPTDFYEILAESNQISFICSKHITFKCSKW